MKDSASFWTDIKKLDEQLAKSPDSLCFARLSEVYLKVGLIDDALHVARQGVAKHPRYLSGLRALSFACHARGLDDEALAAVRLVTEALPEDVQSQRLLGRLHAAAGNKRDASQAFRTALEFAPDDDECRIELESLERLSRDSGYSLPADDENPEDLEEIEILEDDESEEEFTSGVTFSDPGSLSTPNHDPLSTGTLAELYVTQGFINKALEIYRAILVDNPADLVTAGRVAELEALDAVPVEPDHGIGDLDSEEAYDYESVSGISTEACVLEAGSDSISGFAGLQAGALSPDAGKNPSMPPTQGVADNGLATLEGWLVNIGRIKSCR